MDEVAQDFLILEALRMLMANVDDGYIPPHGICHNVDVILMYEFNTSKIMQSHLYLCEYWKTWKHYTGSEDFPVPTRFDDGDNWVGEKRKLRLSLLEHLIHCMEDDLET